MTSRTPLPLALVGFGPLGRCIAERAGPSADIRLVGRGWPYPGVDLPGTRLDLDVPGQMLDEPVAGRFLIVSVPPNRNGNADLRTGNLVSALDARLRRSGERPAGLLYISTTGVYGDCGGEWVDESRPVNPGTARARRRVSAEQQWQQAAQRWGLPCTILRVPGIFACDKLDPARVAQAAPVMDPREAPWSNRVHIEDLADACLALASPGAPAGVFNISDGSPSSLTEYSWALADHFSLPRPPVADRETVLANASPMLREFLSESKRIDARRLREALGWQPRYPDLSAALAACARR